MVHLSNNNIIDNKYILSIQVGLNGLSFCVVDSDKQLIAIDKEDFTIQLSPEQVLNKIKYAFDHIPILKNNFDTIEVIYQNDLYTYVPKALFNNNLLEEYLQYNVKILKNDFIAYDELDQHNLVVVYVPYANINNFFFDTFGSFTYKHVGTILADSLLTKEKNSDSTAVFVNFDNKFFDILIINKGNFILGNSFRYETKEDFLYYLMFTTEQLKLNPEDFRLILLGEIDESSEYFAIAQTYIRNVSIGDFSHGFELSPQVQFFKSHQHFVLLSNF